jgi:serine/threonine-protein kinase
VFVPMLPVLAVMHEPEQASGEAERLDERCDVFGLGPILCEILTGQPAYCGADLVEVLRKAVDADLAEAFVRLDACGADPDLVRLAKDSLAAEAGDRPRDAGVLAAELAAHRESMEARLRRAELAEAEARVRAEGERKRRRLAGALAGSLLLTVLLVGSGFVLTVRAREARETQAREDLAKARASWERPRAGNDPAAWAEARALARRAEALLEQGPGSAELAGQVRRLLLALDDEQADRQMVHRLREAILRGTTVEAERNKTGAIARAYEEAFRLYGIPVQDLPLAEAAGRLCARSIRGELAAALDDWASRKVEPGARKHLQDLAILVDDDERRNDIRRALARKGPDTAANIASAMGQAGGLPNLWQAGWVAETTLKPLDALKRLSTPDQAAGLPAGTVALLARALVAQQALAEAEALLRQARQRHPEDFWINCYFGELYTFKCKPPRLGEGVRFYTAAVAVRRDSPNAHLWLGVALAQHGQLVEAQEAFEEVIRLRPDHELDYAGAHSNLGGVLYKQGKVDQAISHFQEAIRLAPYHPGAHSNLGVALAQKGRLDEAIASYRKALRLTKGEAYPEVHDNLGLALLRKGRPEEAIASFRRAIHFNPDFALSHCGLGLALQDQGRFGEALVSLRRGHALGVRKPGWSHPSAGWVRRCEHLLELERRLPAIQSGKEKPTNPAELVEFAWLCSVKGCYAAAARLYGEAFAAPVEDGQGLMPGNRFGAACCAAWAGGDRSGDAAGLEESEGARWRRQALDWLRADLALHARRLESGKLADRAEVQEQLARWLASVHLAGVRGTEALGKLPAGEREAWARLWVEVEALRAKAQERPSATPSSVAVPPCRAPSARP